MMGKSGSENPDADLIQFLAPGFLHAMGNAFFAIEGHARLVFNDFDRVGPQGEDVLNICARGARAITIYSILVDPSWPVDSQPIGPLATDVAALLRAQLRDVGIKLAFDEAQAGGRSWPVSRMNLSTTTPRASGASWPRAP